MWGAIIGGGILLGEYVYHRWFEDGPPKPPPAAAPTLPRVDLGAPIPRIYGRCRVRAPVCAWAGNFDPTSFDDEYGPGAGNGYVYRLDMLYEVGIPPYQSTARIWKVFAGDLHVGLQLEVAVTPYVSNWFTTTQDIGGPKAGGLINGQVEVFRGSLLQAISDGVNDTAHLTNTENRMNQGGVSSARMPGYRGRVLAFLWHWSIGESNQIQSNGFEVEAFSTAGLGPHLPTEEDPVAVIYDLLTSPFGLGLPPSAIDLASFTAVSATLYAERHGYSRSIENQDDVNVMIEDVLKQIDGGRYEEPTTGRTVLKLARKDYNPLTVPNINPSNCIGLRGYTNGGWGSDAYNAVRIIFTNRANNYSDDDAPDSTGASPVRELQIQFPGCCDRDNAKRLASRELGVIARPMVKCTALVNRSFYMTRPLDVVTLTWPLYGITNLVMRVARVDLGQLFKNEIALDLVIEAFDAQGTGLGGDDVNPDPVIPLPLTRRVFTEAPYWLQWWAWQDGFITDPAAQRVLASGTPDDAATMFEERTALVLGGVFSTPLPDVAPGAFKRSARVAVAYAKTLEPYDTTTGLVVDTISGIPITTGSSFGLGNALVIVGSELISYDSATDLGGGQWRLNNVWRANLDTGPHDHAIGELVVWLDSTRNVGRRAWAMGATVLGVAYPALAGVQGLGGSDTEVIRRRAILPPRVADLTLSGKLMAGTIGVPGSAGLYKLVSQLEEGVDLVARRRDRLSLTIVRGDAADETQTEAGILYAVYATKVGGAPFLIGTLAQASIVGGQGLLVGGAGHGAIDVSIVTQRTVQAGENIAGAPRGTVLSCWDPPTVRVSAPRWRSLLANARFDYNALAPGWALTPGGSAVVASGASSLRRDATGFYLTCGAIKNLNVKQIVAIDGYLARGMSAALICYRRDLVSGADTSTVTLDGLDVASANTGTATTGSGTSPTATWLRSAVTIAALGAGTTQLQATLVGANDAAFTETELLLGTFNYDVLANGSFETGASTSWTVDAGSFVAGTAIAAPSATYCQGGPNATNTQHQDYTLPAGWEFGGTLVARFFRAQTLSGDAGTGTLQILDVSNAVLASATTGAETLSTLNRWERRTLSVNVPTTGLAVKARFIWIALRSAGAGNSGACIDEVVLTPHKNLDAGYERVLSFATPTLQPTPATWQDFHLAYPAILPRPVVLGATGTEPVEMAWSDGIARAAAKVTGLYGGGVSSINGYRFARASGGAAIDFIATGIAAFGPRTFGAFTSADSFTIVVPGFRVEEDGFAVACGLIGRRGTTGYAIDIDATGHLFATLQGDGGTKTATRAGSTVIDGARHLAVLSYDAVAQTLTIADERGSNTVSTATGLGEIADDEPSTVFRLGRSRPTIDTLPGAIEHPLVFEFALSSGQWASLWAYAASPAGLTPTYVRSVPAWAELAPDGDGAVLACMGTDQLALAYGAAGYGFAEVRATTNLIRGFDFGDATKWTVDGSAAFADTCVDATGQPLGRHVRVHNTDGLIALALPMTATATLAAVFYLQADSGAAALSFELQNASGVVKSTVAATVNSALWKRYVVQLTGWDASTPTAQIRIRSTGSSDMFGISHVCFAAQGTEVPTLIPPAATAIGDVTATFTDTIPAQFNSEGEIVVVGVGTIASPAAAALASVHHGSHVDRREVNIGAAAAPTLDHYDLTSTDVASAGTAIDWSQAWTVRGRWCRAKMLDAATNPFAGVVTAGSVASAVYGRTAIFTCGTTANTTIAIGDGIAASAANAIISSVTVRAREQKLV